MNIAVFATFPININQRTAWAVGNLTCAHPNGELEKALSPGIRRSEVIAKEMAPQQVRY